MVGIALDLGWPPLVAFGQHSRRDAVELEGRGVKTGLAGDQTFGACSRKVRSARSAPRRRPAAGLT